MVEFEAAKDAGVNDSAAATIAMSAWRMTSISGQLLRRRSVVVVSRDKNVATAACVHAKLQGAQIVRWDASAPWESHSGLPFAISAAVTTRQVSLATAFSLLIATACGIRGGVFEETVSTSQAHTPNATQQTNDGQHEKQPIRLVTIGDSLAYGTGDEARQGIAGRLRDELIRSGITNATTTNLGVSGAQTADLTTKLGQQRTRDVIAASNVIVLSIGANDLFRTAGAREATLRAPLEVADRILTRVQAIVTTLHQLNPKAQILILGAYNPVPTHQWAPMIDQYLTVWDQTLASRFASDRRVSIVKMSDLVTKDRLSRFDHFHPGGSAYEAIAKRIATMLVEQ
jgi:lysophospholipase L1-like esterase